MTKSSHPSRGRLAAAVFLYSLIWTSPTRSSCCPPLSLPESPEPILYLVVLSLKCCPAQHGSIKLMTWAFSTLCIPESLARWYIRLSYRLRDIFAVFCELQRLLEGSYVVAPLAMVGDRFWHYASLAKHLKDCLCKEEIPKTLDSLYAQLELVFELEAILHPVRYILSWLVDRT